MKSFSIYAPTRIFFGSERCDQFVDKVLELGTHVFLVMGGGTVEKLGFVQPLAEKLKARGLKVTMFRGIEPNPEAATISQAAAVLKRVGADLVMPVGGGSVIDAAKAIAALGFSGEDDIWPFVLGSPRALQLTGALPVAAVPTTAPNAAEVTGRAVISNRSARSTSSLRHEALKPSLAWLNPEFTRTLSPALFADGAAHVLAPVLESYLTGDASSRLADRYAEMIVATVLESLPAAAHDESARADLQWAATLALNDFGRAGRPETELLLQAMEQSLTSRKPELAQGRGLAALYPAYFRWLLASGRSRDRFAQLGSRLFGATGDESARADAFVSRFESWLRDNGLGQSLGELGFSREEYPAMARDVTRTVGLPTSAVTDLLQLSESSSLAAAV